jgi:hypothetical protein
MGALRARHGRSGEKPAAASPIKSKFEKTQQKEIRKECVGQANAMRTINPAPHQKCEPKSLEEIQGFHPQCASEETVRMLAAQVEELSCLIRRLCRPI